MVRNFGQLGRGFGSLGRSARRTTHRPNAPEPGLILKSLLFFGDKDQQGRLVEAVRIPWSDILKIFDKDPLAIYQIDPYKWEEIIAGAYQKAGFDEVVLTPRSGDGGKDIIATKHGIGSIRIFDQVKAYKPDHLVTANDVRAMIGVISATPNVSKGMITTTSRFAPRVKSDETIRPFIPYRLELKEKDELMDWLRSVSD